MQLVAVAMEADFRLHVPPHGCRSRCCRPPRPRHSRKADAVTVAADILLLLLLPSACIALR